MNNIFSEKAWDDYLYWQMTDKATLRKINELIKDIHRNGLSNRYWKTRSIKAQKSMEQKN